MSDFKSGININENSKIDINIEEILLNLKMISSINQNDKLYLEERLFKIDRPTIIQGFTRWFHDYSRIQTMDNIDDLVELTIIYVDAIFKKTDRTHTDNRICQNILVEISNVIKGLQNLKITYLNDTFVQSKLELIQEKFNVCKNNLSSKLTVSE
jgi:hypothetical protein|tara:strand:+ start:2011 stop:2475 length:465 start_codon:yes stop_codon:yes gene_type:complete